MFYRFSKTVTIEEKTFVYLNSPTQPFLTTQSNYDALHLLVKRLIRYHKAYKKGLFDDSWGGLVVPISFMKDVIAECNRKKSIVVASTRRHLFDVLCFIGCIILTLMVIHTAFSAKEFINNRVQFQSVERDRNITLHIHHSQYNNTEIYSPQKPLKFDFPVTHQRPLFSFPPVVRTRGFSKIDLFTFFVTTLSSYKSDVGFTVFAIFILLFSIYVLLFDTIAYFTAARSTVKLRCLHIKRPKLPLYAALTDKIAKHCKKIAGEALWSKELFQKDDMVQILEAIEYGDSCEK